MKEPLYKYSIILLTSAIFTACATETKVSQVSKDDLRNSDKILSHQLVNSVLWFQQSAEMVASYHQAYKYAEMLLDNKLKTVRSRLPLAVVLDIDETVLDNSPYEAQMIEKGTSYESSSWKIWADEARAKALPGALDFVNFAKERNVEVFYISNRKSDVHSATVENLKKHGFPFADDRHVILSEGSNDKTSRREKVVETHTVLVYVGDNLTDYSELYAHRDLGMGKELVEKNKNELLHNFVILPNPMYGEWEGAIYENNYGISSDMKVKKKMNVLEK